MSTRFRGLPPSWDQAATAAALYAGPIAAVSHAPAAYKWELPGFERPPIEVTTTRSVTGRGIMWHSRTRLELDDIARIDGVPISGVERTLLDLAGTVSEARLESALDNVFHRRLTTEGRLTEYLKHPERLPRRQRSALSKLLAVRGDVVATESDLETGLARVLRDPSLPPASRQFRVFSGKRFLARLDFAYPFVKLGVEAHSYKHHRDRQQWERDLYRHALLEAAGWYVIYVTNADLKLRRRATIERIRCKIDERLSLVAG